jgi:uncharacterized protein YqgC (DUF456 family)
MSKIILTAVFAVLLLPGVFMVFIPIAPAISYMFLMATIYGFIDQFTNLTFAEFGILAGILFVSILVDFFSGIIGAKYGGASRKAIFYGISGTILGVIAFPPFGGILGLFAGVFLAEMIKGRKESEAFKAASGALMGATAGVIINSVLAVTLRELENWLNKKCPPPLAGGIFY